MQSACRAHFVWRQFRTAELQSCRATIQGPGAGNAELQSCRAFAERLQSVCRARFVWRQVRIAELQSYRATERGSRQGRPGQPAESNRRAFAERLQRHIRMATGQVAKLQSSKARIGGGPAARPRGRRPRVIAERLQSVCRARFVWRQVSLQSYRAPERDRGKGGRAKMAQITEGYRARTS